MPIPVSLPGFEGRTITLESNMWSGQPKLTLDGYEIKPTIHQNAASPSPPGRKSAKGSKNEFLLRQNDGREVLVRVKPAFPDPAPVLEVNGQIIRTARQLTIFEWIWAAFPLVLLLGGIVGGGLGMFATITNLNLIREDSKGILRYVMCAVVTTFAFLTCFIVIAALQNLIKR
ncbi:hypothetical protein IAD21_00816 [Abditibacteriota bacterium]|nr:hypothetical protein IAD21_00816 [Abditibacteriota bacterium]